MIIWGSGSRSMDVKNAGIRHCATCGHEREHKIILNYNFAHLYYFRWVTSRTYYLACDICRRGIKLDGRETEKALGNDPIPFMTRYGWAFLLGIPGILIALSLLGTGATQAGGGKVAPAPRLSMLTPVDAASSAFIAVPKPGSNAVLSMPEVRYCALEQLRLDTIKPLVNAARGQEVREFNQMVVNYNRSCPGTSARRGDVEKAKREIDQRRDELVREATEEWSRKFAPV